MLHSMLLLFLLIASAVGSDAALELGYTYLGRRGPSHWGDLRSDWSQCKLGRLQSPIAILRNRTRLDSQLPKLYPQYSRAVPCSILSTRYMFKVLLSGGKCTLNTSNASFGLTDFHFHAPSEHTIDGVHFPLEMHMVHRSSALPQQRILVVSRLFRLGKRDPLLARFLRMGVNTSLDTEKLMTLGEGYYDYVGSLTTPPCTEGVSWRILKKVRSISHKQLQHIKSYLQGNNARPVQRINHRLEKETQY